MNNINQIDRQLITPNGYEQTKYTLTIKNIDFDYEIDDDDEIDKSKVYVEFVLTEISSGIDTGNQSMYKSINFKGVDA